MVQDTFENSNSYNDDNSKYRSNVIKGMTGNRFGKGNSIGSRNSNGIDIVKKQWPLTYN